ncbi:hypothetical protein Vadar_024840 [Vaccinium darrowii]|nr:hypothetical protein Vadar_024840 [Vaccinium darrowii]
MATIHRSSSLKRTRSIFSETHSNHRSSLSLTLESKEMGRSSSSAQLTLSLFFFFSLLISLAHSFYLPGVAPRDFQRFNMREEQPCKVACRAKLDAESAKNVISSCSSL